MKARLAGALALLAATPSAGQAIPERVDGYDARALYNAYVDWVVGQYLPVARAALDERGPADAKPVFSLVMVQGGARSDAAIFEAVRTCGAGVGGRKPCEVRLRSAVLDDADADGWFWSRRWIEDHFDATRMVAGLRRRGISPAFDLKGVDPEELFADQARPTTFIAANALAVTEIASTQCPGFDEALAGAGPAPTIARSDPEPDPYAPVAPPRPEPVGRMTLSALAMSAGWPVTETVDASGPSPLFLHYAPAIQAAIGCLEGR